MTCGTVTIDELQKIHEEIVRLKRYEDLVKFIANDYHELSHDKAKWQRDDWKNRCKKLIEQYYDEIDHTG